MKTPSFVLALAVAAAVTAPAARDARAGYTETGIQKCRGADGGVVYTDKPCETFGAKPEAMSAELGVRLASEPAVGAVAPGMDTLATGAIAIDGTEPAGALATGRRSLAAGCARTPTQLAMDVQASIGLHDVNRLAESYHWAGMSHEQAMPVMRQLETLARAQVVGAQVHAMAMSTGLQFADASGAAPMPQGGVLSVALHTEEGPRSLQLNVLPYAGCYFARF